MAPKSPKSPMTPGPSQAPPGADQPDEPAAAPAPPGTDQPDEMRDGWNLRNEDAFVQARAAASGELVQLFNNVMAEMEPVLAAVAAPSLPSVMEMPQLIRGGWDPEQRALFTQLTITQMRRRRRRFMNFNPCDAALALNIRRHVNGCRCALGQEPRPILGLWQTQMHRQICSDGRHCWCFISGPFRIWDEACAQDIEARAQFR